MIFTWENRNFACAWRVNGVRPRSFDFRFGLKPFFLLRNQERKVKKSKADIGIALDGDADRIIVCDENGETLDGDEIIAVCANEMIKNNSLKNNIVVV